MKKYLRLLIILLVILSAIGALKLSTLQTLSQAPPGWHWVTVGTLSLCVPDSFEFKKVQGLHGELSLLIKGDTLIEIDDDGSKGAYNVHRSNPSYSERRITIDGCDAKLISFEDTVSDQPVIPPFKSTKYLIGVDIENPGLFSSSVASVWINYDSPSEQETANSILRSIRLKRYTWRYFRLRPATS
jgi:hypothetical protein